ESEKNSKGLTNATAETAEENATSGENVTEKSAESPNTPQEEATLSTNEAAPKKVYYLQVGVFRNRSNAVRFASELKSKGFDAKTEFFDDKTRVVGGDFDSQKEALSVKRDLKRKGFDSILKWREE
ncbi:MAG: SPOR domain-containing protein, partial [Desulfurobacteriaceae bacterium]